MPKNTKQNKKGTEIKNKSNKKHEILNRTKQTKQDEADKITQHENEQPF